MDWVLVFKNSAVENTEHRGAWSYLGGLPGEGRTANEL